MYPFSFVLSPAIGAISRLHWKGSPRRLQRECFGRLPLPEPRLKEVATPLAQIHGFDPAAELASGRLQFDQAGGNGVLAAVAEDVEVLQGWGLVGLLLVLRSCKATQDCPDQAEKAGF